MEFGSIFFGFEAVQGWAPTYAQNSQKWQKAVGPWRNRVPDGTHPMDWFGGNFISKINDSIMSGKNRFVFGNMLRHAGIANDVLRGGLDSAFFSSSIEDSPLNFGSDIAVYGHNILVANNVIPKQTYTFPVAYRSNSTRDHLPDTTVALIPFDYGKNLSIDVNKNYIAW